MTRITGRIASYTIKDDGLHTIRVVLIDLLGKVHSIVILDNAPIIKRLNARGLQIPSIIYGTATYNNLRNTIEQAFQTQAVACVTTYHLGDIGNTVIILDITITAATTNFNATACTVSGSLY